MFQKSDDNQTIVSIQQKNKNSEGRPTTEQDVIIDLGFLQGFGAKEKVQHLTTGFSGILNDFTTEVEKNNYLRDLLRRYEETPRFFMEQFKKLGIQLPSNKYELSHNGMLDPSKYTPRERMRWLAVVCTRPNNYRKIKKLIEHFISHLPTGSKVRAETTKTLQAMNFLQKKTKNPLSNHTKESSIVDDMKGYPFQPLQKEEYKFTHQNRGTITLTTGAIGVCSFAFWGVLFTYLTTKHLGWSTSDIKFKCILIAILLFVLFISICIMLCGCVFGDLKGEQYKRSYDAQALTSVTNGLLEIFKTIEETPKSSIKFEK